MSIAVTNMKIHLSSHGNEFKIRKVSGAAQHVLAPDGKHVDIELREVRHGERKEILIELELDVPTPGSASNEGRDSSSRSSSASRGGHQTESSSDDSSLVPPSRSHHLGVNTSPVRSGRAPAIPRSMSSTSTSLGDVTRLGEALYASSGSATAAQIEDLPVLDLDCSFTDPSAAKSCTRLAKPLLLTLTLLSPASTAHSSFPDPPSTTSSEPLIVRRRMELLVSDMMTRSLLLVAKGNHTQAQRLMGETRMIVRTVVNTLLDQLASSNAAAATAASAYASSTSIAKSERKDAANRATILVLEAILQDVELVLEGLEEESRPFFERETRCFTAQQVSRSLVVVDSEILSSTTCLL